MKRAFVAAGTLALSFAAHAQQAAPPESVPAASEWSPPAQTAQSPFTLGGYADVGFAVAQGDGTSWLPADTRLPADYHVDTFATAVNSRGDVASADPHGRFVNGFLPRSVGIGGQPSLLLNTFDVDARYVSPSAPLMFFGRVQVLPRFGAGNDTRLLIEQAFGRVIPFASQELALSVGKFDSVFGIEYLENEANLRTNITPSLLARYTTGQSLGVKAFYRVQLPKAWSAVSFNVAATNGGSLVETLSPPDLSLAGRPIATGRLGYELNLPAVEVKLGLSGLYGPRNDQHDPRVRQHAVGLDARVVSGWFSLSGELLRIHQDAGAADKTNGLGAETIASAFDARGFYLLAALGIPLADNGAFRKLTPYARYEQRRAYFEGISPYTVDRVTLGFRLDVWDELIVKAEGLLNGERSGLPTVANNVFTSSVVWTF